MSDSILGLIRSVLLSTAVTVMVGCPGDPTEANSGIADGTGGSADDSISATMNDDSVSVSFTDTADGDATNGTDPTDTDTGDGPECGDGIVESPETCDLGPNNTMGATCTDACRDNVCNDGYVGYGESCDPPGRGCEDNCILSSCGDGVVDGTIGEECDPPEPGVCSPTCEMAGCNDGIIDPNLGEQCEGNNLDDMTCMSLGYFAGDLQCDSQCHFVVSSCTNCGNGSVQAPEQCDGGVGTSTCVTLDFDFGNLLCSTTCAFDTSGCGNAVCGNDILEPTEACDTNQLNGNSCASMGYADTDDIECVACMLDFSGCTLCGNGVLDGAETCEMGMDIPDMCSEVPPFDNDSAVVCNFATCQLDVSMCCGDDHDDPCTEDEDCCGPTFDCGDNSTCCLEGGQPCGGNDGLCCSGDCLPSNNCMNE